MATEEKQGSELFELNDSEKLFKRFYREHEMEFLGNSMDFSQYETLLEHYPGLPDFRRHMGAFSSVLHMTWKDINVAVAREDRYVYSIKHTHTYFEMHYVYSGTCRHFINDEMMYQTAGQICILSPHAWHSTALLEDDCVGFNIFVDRSFFEHDFLLGIQDTNPISTFVRNCLEADAASSYIQFSTGSDLPLNPLVLAMCEETCHTKCYRRETLILYMNQLLLKLLRDHSRTVIMPEPVKVKIYSRLTEVLDYIQTNYTDVTLANLALRFNYNKEYLSRYIKICTGKTFSRLVQEVRMKNARDLLLYTDTSITQISSEVGYYDLSHFLRSFKKYYGVAPGELRKNR